MSTADFRTGVKTWIRSEKDERGTETGPLSREARRSGFAPGRALLWLFFSLLPALPWEAASGQVSHRLCGPADRLDSLDLVLEITEAESLDPFDGWADGKVDDFQLWISKPGGAIRLLIDGKRLEIFATKNPSESELPVATTVDASDLKRILENLRAIRNASPLNRDSRELFSRLPSSPDRKIPRWIVQSEGERFGLNATRLIRRENGTLTLQAENPDVLKAFQAIEQPYVEIEVRRISNPKRIWKLRRGADPSASRSFNGKTVPCGEFFCGPDLLRLKGTRALEAIESRELTSAMGEGRYQPEDPRKSRGAFRDFLDDLTAEAAAVSEKISAVNERERKAFPNPRFTAGRIE